jgi:hypothetical protein
LIEPHCQRDPTAFRVDLQDFDTDDIARLRDFARVLDVSIGHRGDVHQPVLVDPHINEGAERGDVRHDTFENHAGLDPRQLEAVAELSRHGRVTALSLRPGRSLAELEAALAAILPRFRGGQLPKE